MLRNLLDKRFDLSRTQVFIVYGLILILFAFYYTNMYEPKAALITRKQNELEDVTRSLARSDIEQAELERLNQELEKIQREMDRYAHDLPESMLPEDLIKHIHELAALSNVSVQNITFSPARPYGGVTSTIESDASGTTTSPQDILMVLPVELTVEGSWTDFHVFLSVAYAFREGLFQISNLQTAAADGVLADELQMQITVLYLYRGGEAGA